MDELLQALANPRYDLNGCLRNCTNRGLCLLDTRLQVFTCSCDSLFSGRHCQIDDRNCSQSQCLNQGKCTSSSQSNSTSLVSSSLSTCQCEKNFNGTYCEIYLDVCESEKCSNNGHCWVRGNNNEVICKCYEDYSGEQCEKANVMSKIIKYVRVSSLTLFLSGIGTFVFLIVFSPAVFT